MPSPDVRVAKTEHEFGFPVNVSEIGPCIKGVNPATRVISVKGGMIDLATGRMMKVGSVAAREAVEADIARIAAEENITDPVVEQAKAEHAAEARREQHTLLSAGQRSAAIAIRDGQMDEMRVGPLGNLIAGPLRRAEAAKAEEREKAVQAEARARRDRERARAEEADAAARKSGPGAGGHKIVRVAS
jgi:hypothetical protein